ncbi:two-partner secretion domain-containing protein [Roseobacteraceae bacterium S113]
MVSVKRILHNSTALTSASLAMLLLASAASANPLDGQVVAGDATISAPDPSTLVINQGSQNVVLEWGSFNIDPGETTTFVQPNVDAWALNRVVGSQDPSVIAGTLNANGNIAIVNPDGIVFSQGARVDVGGLVATTADIDNDAFMRGELSFNLPGNPAASAINAGTLSVRDHGLAAFVAPGVRNSGVITARFGTVSLASGNTFALDLYGDGLVSLAIGDEITEEVIDVATGKVMADLVNNEGKIEANGGTVALTAATARNAVNSVVNNSGVIEANSVGMRNGKIILGAQTSASRPVSAPRQTVRISGSVRTSAVTTSPRPVVRPGTIEITGEDIVIAGATLDASGTNAGGTILIGGDYLGGQEISDLFPVGEEVREDYDVATAATVAVDNATTINASATDNGDGGKIILWSDVATTTSAEIVAFGSGDGTGGFIETSSAGTLSLPDGYVSAGQGGTWLLDPEQLYVSNQDAVFGNTEFVSATTVEASLNAGTNVSLISSGDDARTGINSQISKTAGGDATLSIGSTGSVSINANITSTSGELNVVVKTADTLEPFVNGSLTGFRDGVLTISDATIETNGGDFGYRGAAFQMTNSIVTDINGAPTDHRPGNIRTDGGAMLFELSALPSNAAPNSFTDVSGTIGCNGFYEFSCGQLSSVLDAGDGAIVFRQNPNATTTNSDDFPRIFVGDYGIATTGTLTLDGVNLRSQRRTNRNGVYNIEFGTLSLLNGAIVDFPLQDGLGLEAFYTPVAVSGVSLPTGTYRVGERITIQLPTLFTSPNSPIQLIDVFGPSGGSYQIIGNELIIDYNGPAGPINLTFRATTFAGTSTDLVLSLNIQEAVTPPPPVNEAPVANVTTLQPVQIEEDQRWEYTSAPGVFSDDGGAENLTLTFTGLQTRPTGGGVLRIERRVNADGSFTIIVPAGFILAGNQNITFTVSDGEQTATTSLALTVTAPPVVPPEPPTTPDTGIENGTAGQQVDNPSAPVSEMPQRPNSGFVLTGLIERSPILPSVSSSREAFEGVGVIRDLYDGAGLYFNSVTTLVSHYEDIFGKEYRVGEDQTYAQAVNAVLDSTSKHNLAGNTTLLQLSLLIGGMRQVAEIAESRQDNRLDIMVTAMQNGIGAASAYNTSKPYAENVSSTLTLAEVIEAALGFDPEVVEKVFAVHQDLPEDIRLQDLAIATLVDQGDWETLQDISTKPIYDHFEAAFGLRFGSTSNGVFSQRYPEIQKVIDLKFNP